MSPNQSKLENYPLVDFPGHHRLREGLKQHLLNTGMIIFVVDANATKPVFMSDADYLYTLFTDSYVNETQVPFCIACNKSDLLTALPKEEIKLILERELNEIRASQMAQPGREELQDKIFLGIEGEKFSMDHVPFPVQFVQISVKDLEDPGWQELLTFIREHKP
eukprot:TRINITY_DN100_c0_g1_i7.p1 TRINITY_DN100_c0_g1~~TRINITY_DN100_c0_g1_i7.p1  ORF type:complete len:164 (-),score=39.13 TRINITY_DN100_c0_g1_i7:161-652(-)